MKTSMFRVVLLVLSISFLPLAISGLPPLIRLPTANSGILDTDGNPVVAGAKYYAVPALIGLEGGISVTNLNTANPSACPTDVVLNLTLAGNIPPALARPITFYPLHGDDGAPIQEQYPLNVAFDSPDSSDPCAKDNVWKLQARIMTGGVIGDEGDIFNWFRIQKNFNGGPGYLFNWWPSLCLGCRIGYFHIGTVNDGYQLGLNDESPYAFQFVKAE